MWRKRGIFGELHVTDKTWRRHCLDVVGFTRSCHGHVPRSTSFKFQHCTLTLSLSLSHTLSLSLSHTLSLSLSHTTH